MKNKINKGIIAYLKKTYPNSPNFEEPDQNGGVKYKFIKKVYEDLTSMYTLGYVNITEQDKDTFNRIFKDTYESQGGYMYLRREDSFIQNVRCLEFSGFYPQIFRLFYHNGMIPKNIENEMYVYLVENRIDIKKGLTPEENKLLRVIINYKYGILWKEYAKNINSEDLGIKRELPYQISSFARQIMNDIMNIDNNMYEDIIYIDTDAIYFYNNDILLERIESYLNGLFRLEIDEPKSYMFIAKKKYIEFEDLGHIKFRGISVPPFYKNKYINNLAYDLYCSSREEPCGFKQFMHPQGGMKEKRQKYIREAKSIIERKNKLNRILNNK